MKFVSRNSNLMVVLKPGLPGNHLSGTAAVTGVYVKFQNGQVDVKEDSLIEMMKKHPAFNTDFIAVEENIKDEDPYAYYRSEIEPTHVVSEIKYGHVEKAVSSAPKRKMPPELEAMIKAEASKMAKEMLPDLIRETIQSMKTENKDKETGSSNVKIDSKVIEKKDKKDKSDTPTE
jgi:hypothetical protein